MSIQNKISLVISPEEVKEVNDAISVLVRVLQPKLIQLKPEDRKALLKVGNKAVSFIVKTIGYADKYPELLPAYFNLEEAKIDQAAFATLLEFFEPLEKLIELLRDTMSLTGSEAYSQTLTIYETVKTAYKNRYPGAELIYNELKTWFPRTSSTAEPEEESGKTAS